VNLARVHGQRQALENGLAGDFVGGYRSGACISGIRARRLAGDGSVRRDEARCSCQRAFISASTARAALRDRPARRRRDSGSP
jgi:hypothetical protein